MRLLRIALVCAVVLVALTVAVVLVLPHSRAAAKGYLDSARDCYHGERLLKLNSLEDPIYAEGSGFLLRREGIDFQYSTCLRSSPCASYNRAYTRMTRYVLSRDYGYDIYGELEELRKDGGVIVRVTH